MDRSELDRAASLGGLTLPSDQRITVAGAGPIYPSPIRLHEGAATIHALLGSAASALWELKAGRKQDVQVDMLQASASLLSPAFCRVDGLMPEELPMHPPVLPRGGKPPTTDLFECADGRWVHLQSEFPRLLDGLLAFLECENTPESVAQAVKQWNGEALEDALAEQGLCGAMARDPDEWLAHPQGALLAGLPIVEIERIGDAPPEPLPGGHRPLSGVRVFDSTRVLAGPTCARTLASHGADVLHIASPTMPTRQTAEIDTGHGKRQAFLDYTSPEGLATAKRLIAESDVFSQSFRTGRLDRLGLAPTDLATLRPGIIYSSVNCYGHHGDWRERPGWEQLAQTVTGTVNVQGSPETPAVTGTAANDYGTGYLAAYGVMEALRRRAIEGGSWHVRVSLAQTSMWYLRLGTDQDPAQATGIAAASKYVESHDSGYGRVDHLAPVVQMSETPARWEQPVEPLGTHAPEWLLR